MHAKHAKGAQKDIVLVTSPSSDPDDPMNMFLAFGWGRLFWQHCALQYGKRPVYLISILATMVIQVWTPYTKSNGKWIVNKVLHGFFGAPIESLCEISITDIYFQHQRGAYIGLYAMLLAGSNSFAPIIAGFIADGQGWQWVLYWCAIFCGTGFAFLFFSMEETNYSRVVLIGHENEFHKPNHLTGMVSRPPIFLTFLVIVYAGLSYGSNLVWFNILNDTASLILGSPYSFPAWAVGLYISPIVGVAIGSFYTGPIGDRIVLKMARRNNGVLDPEHRLCVFLPSLVLVPFGPILWGVCAAHAINWFGCVFAMSVIALTNTIGLQLSVSYCIDSYRDLAGEALVTVILVRNRRALLSTTVSHLCYILFVKYGKGLRAKSASRYSHYVEKMASSGLIY
ncbi:MAG: hypothetical protein FE78DRAFT_78468 [Acidomyces sp. 'richmondensis']|nr:MAG: hypothetical protein FE78DRAFT_78468 [Acidomyces sp. 'richmondensis']